MSAEGSLSMIVVTHNEGASLTRTVSSLLSTGPADADLIVVDDLSTDGSVEALRTELGDVRIVRPSRRLGPASARNFGASLTSGKAILWADAHVDPPPGWFGSFAPLLQRPDVGAVGPAVSTMGNEGSVGFGMRWKSAGLDVEWLPKTTECDYPVPMLGGCFFAMRRDVFECTGGFDEGLILWGGGDVELSFRLWMLGLECRVVPGTRVPHLFRSRFPYAVDSANVLHNLLRIAFVHFSESRMARVVGSLRSNPVFPKALARAVTNGVWSKRAEMLQRRHVDDDWFFARFPMPGLGQDEDSWRSGTSSDAT